MNVLAIDTSTDWLSLAACRGDARFASDIEVGHGHAETAIPSIVALLAEAGIGVDAVDACVFGAGPGAFTGLRIACGVVQGLAAARGVPVLGVSCLEAVAAAAHADHAVVCLDARMGEVYHAAYRRESGGVWAEVSAPRLTAPGDVPLAEGSGWLGCGSGFRAHRDALLGRLGPSIALVNAEVRPTAAAMLELALPRLLAGGGEDASRAVPVYLRDRVALTVAERAERRP